MGTFLGHVVPGTFFICFSLWWSWATLHKYFLQQREVYNSGRKKSVTRYRNTPTFPCTCCCSTNLPIEGIFKIVAVIIGMTGEFATAFNSEGRFDSFGNAQHMTMFFFFGLNGVMDILTHYRFPLPPDIDYTSGILALCMEALLFYYHIHGRPQLDILVHMLLFYVIVCCAVATACEMKYRNNVLPALCKDYFILLQGTWFYQVAFILYPPSGNQWDEHDHKQMMIVTMLFTWHNAVIFLFLLLMGIVIYHRVKRMENVTAYRCLIKGSPPGGALDALIHEECNKIMESEDEEEV